MSEELTNSFSISPQYQPLARRLGLDAETIFDHPEIKAWRRLPDRQNCTLDYTDEAGGRIGCTSSATSRSPKSRHPPPRRKSAAIAISLMKKFPLRNWSATAGSPMDAAS